MKLLEATVIRQDGPCTLLPGIWQTNGRFHLSCLDSSSCEWVENPVSSLELTEDDTKFRIQLVRPSEVLKLKRAQVYITGPPLAVPRVTRLLAGQNRGIHTESWRLRHQQDAANGQTARLGHR